MRRLILAAAVAAGLMGFSAGRSNADQGSGSAPRFGLPIACVIGQSCWIQHYVDCDPTPAALDYTGGSLTYDGHKGTDIRIPDMARERQGVNVLAAADGTVLRLRDGVNDVSVRIKGLTSVEGKECGNGLVIDHGGGWQTQYCHLAKGSLVVRAGQSVKAGEPLGHVGLSGETEFPHLHFQVSHDGAIVDPFASFAAAGAPCGRGESLWLRPPAYTPRAVINTGFSSQPLDMAAIEGGTVSPMRSSSPFMIAYVRVIGLRAGDQSSLSLLGASGETLAASPASRLQHSEDQRFLFVGKRRPTEGWAHGVYKAHYEVRAGDKVVLERDFDISL